MFILRIDLQPQSATKYHVQPHQKSCTYTSAGSTFNQLSAQWSNPSDVLSLLLLIGGDIVQKALANTAGDPLTPICFSFGWVSDAFTSLFAILGDGRLLSPSDYPVKVFNLESGYLRENKNFDIGRILRGHEIRVNREFLLSDGTLRMSVYEALEYKELTARPEGRGRWGGLGLGLR
jgi:hypothetical protein